VTTGVFGSQGWLLNEFRAIRFRGYPWRGASRLDRTLREVRKRRLLPAQERLLHIFEDLLVLLDDGHGCLIGLLWVALCLGESWTLFRGPVSPEYLWRLGIPPAIRGVEA